MHQHKNSVKSNMLTVTNEVKQTPKITQISVDYYLKKVHNHYELTGNFANKKDIEKIRHALASETLKERVNINKFLVRNSDAIKLTEQIMPLLTNYLDASVQYDNNQLTVEGTVTKNAHRDAVSSVLANFTMPTHNNTKVISIPNKPMQVSIVPLSKEEAMAIESKIRNIIETEEINFMHNKAKLTPKSIVTTQHIATILQNNSQIIVKISAKILTNEENKENKTLYQKRVVSVKERLVQLGISANRFIVISYEESANSLVSNDTPHDKQLTVKGD